jgi:mono/diheme cytochrome c family protein
MWTWPWLVSCAKEEYPTFGADCETYECLEKPQYAPGDAERGRDAILDVGLFTCGIPAAAVTATPGVVTGETVPGRTGPNEGLPYNVTQTTAPSGVEVLHPNCFDCHGGHVDGELVLGLGNPVFDGITPITPLVQAARVLVETDEERAELDRYLGPAGVLDAYRTDTLGLSTHAVGFALAAHRDPETLAWSDAPLFEEPVKPARPNSIPPMWRMAKQDAMFANAAARGDWSKWLLNGVITCTESVEEASRALAMAADVRAWIQEIEPPAFPKAVDAEAAARGQEIFDVTCAPCHGTYGADETFPNLIVPVDLVGTDPSVVEDRDYWVEAWEKSFDRMEYSDGVDWVLSDGYVAPPLDGVWATAPFLHNGSVPTLELVLDSAARPAAWKRTSIDSTDYDWDAGGWNFEEVAEGSKATADPETARLTYETASPGASNQGHTFGDWMTPEQRSDVVEYLKTL